MRIKNRSLAFFTDLLSKIIGWLAEIQPPQFINSRVIGWYIKKYNVDLSEVKDPLDSFASMQNFFIRDLKENSRQIEDGLVSPVDGTLRESGNLDSQLALENIKGKPYLLADLIKDSNLAEKFSMGCFFNFYLSPRDYHHVHAPCSGCIKSVRYIPGMLLPVNDWCFKKVPFLFAVNERVVFEIESEFGTVLAVMVGALNVGKIKITLPGETEVIRRSGKSGFFKSYEEQSGRIEIKAGERIGSFLLGSSVVLLCEKNFDSVVGGGSHVKYGQSLGAQASRLLV